MDSNHSQTLPQNLVAIPALSSVVNLVAHLPGAILFTTDTEGNYTSLAGAGLECLGIVPEEWIGRSVFELLKDYPELQATIRRVLQGETITGKSLFGNHYFEDHFCPVYDSEGKLLGAAGVQFNVTEKVRVDNELTQNIGLLENLFDNVPEITHVLDRDFKILMANRASREIFTDVPLIGDTCYKMISGFEEPCPWCPVIEMYQTGLSAKNEFYDEQRDRYQELSCFPIHDQEGNIIGAVEMATEVTEKRKAQEALQKSEALLLDLFASISDGVFVIDRDYTILRANRAMEEMYPKYLPLVGKKCYETSQLDHVCSNCPARRMFELKKPVSMEYCERSTGDEPEKWLEHTAYPIFDKNTGEVTSAITIIRDVTERKRTELEIQKYRAELEISMDQRTHELALSEAKLRTILETSMAAISFVDWQGNVTYVNKAYKELFGYSENDVYGKSALLFSGGTEEDHQGFWNILEGKTDYNRVTTLLYTKSGQPVWVDISASVVRSTDPTETQLLSVIVDVTERQRILEELQQAKNAAEEASQAKSQFLATMSHEIRTPLNGVIGISDLLMETPLQPKQFEYAKLIKASGESLLFLINDILDFSKIEAGKFDLEESEFNIYDLVEAVLGILASKADENNLELIATFDNRVPGPVVGDKGRLRQVLVNLVGNALKFTEKGGVRIHVSLDKVLDDRVSLKFSVIDTGIGIAKERQDRLFKSFSQVDASSARIYGGTGLGLAISKRLVDLMDGDIHVESEEGKGATFWFTACFKCLPLVLKCIRAEIAPCIAERRNYCHGTPPERCARSGRDVAYLQKVFELQGLQTLLVGTGDVKIPALMEQMQAWKMEVQSVPSPKEALDCLEKEQTPFRLILIDFLSKDYEAESFVRKIQDDERFREVALVFFSPLSEDLRQKSWKRPEKIRLITKPICCSLLLDAIVRSFFEFTALPASVAPVETSLNLGTNPSVRLLVAEDNQINRIVISEILKKSGLEYTLVENGEQAVEIVKEISFDVVLMDCQMPLMDGYEATEKIRQWEKDSSQPTRLPIIALTANATSEDEAKCLAVGMDAYCSKPIDAAKLIGLIQKQIKNEK